LNRSRDGLNASIVALPTYVSAWPTLLDFFSAQFPHVSRDVWLQRFASGEILYAASFPVGAVYRDHVQQDEDPFCGDAGRGKPLLQTIAQATDAPRTHAKLTYFRSVENETPIPVEERIVYQDDNILVADKPHFLPVVPSGRYVNETLLARLQRRTGIATLVPAHRIDRETAGLVLFTVRPAVRNAYQSMFRSREMEKTYEAIAVFRRDLQLPILYRSRLVRATQFMQMQTVEGEPNAETRIELIERSGSLAKYRLTPISGARHQLRAQLAALGIPIINDSIYPTLAIAPIEANAAPLKLVAKTLAFFDPIAKTRREFHSAFDVQFV
jgi:tRNA pseudouridine32 synthase / 23S rRNA pseudouridine746 synthase